MDPLTTNVRKPSQRRLLQWNIRPAWGLGIWILLSTLPVHATEAQAPWECSAYRGDAHTRCLQAYIEIQRDKIAKLEGQLQAQQGVVGQLKEQVDRQASARAELQRQLSERPSTVQPRSHIYLYPPAAFSFYWGRPWSPWYDGPPYFYGPSFSFYYGPRFFRHCRGPWRGCW